ncbi:MAG: Quinohemoprotein ethanol dehydrogenase type precursor [Planctomycetota bacterium]|jgi:outer membrane protein assembly factor BamB
MSPKLFPRLSSGLLSLALTSLSADAGDWPQLLGPNRNGVAVQETLYAEWSAQGPAVLWEAPVGAGFAGLAVQGDRAIAFVREGRSELVRCYSTASGKVLWESATPCNWQGGISSDKGPRCVPVIAGDRVLTFGVEGRLRCVRLADGQEVWQRDTNADFKPLEGYFGVGSTPVVFQDRVIVNVGGRDNASVVAFSLNDGSTLWQVFTDAASYSSPIVTQTGDTTLALVVTRLHLLGINAFTGEQVFSVPFGARGPTVNGATPIVDNGRVFVSSSYNIGALLAEFTSTSIQELKRDETFLATQYATPVAGSREGVVFAVDGRQDDGLGSASLKCLDLNSWTVKWEQTGLDYGSAIRVDKDLLVLTCGGELIRVRASEDRYQEVARAQVLKPSDSGYRLPALSGGRLFIRDDQTLRCLDVGPRSGGAAGATKK